MLYEDLLFLWIAFLIGEFSPSFSISSSFSFLFVLFFFKEFFFFLGLYLCKNFLTSFEKLWIFSRNVLLFLSFLFFFLDLSFFQFNTFFSQIYGGSILSFLWFLHYFIPIKIVCFQISTSYLRIIGGLIAPFLCLIIIKDTLEIFNLEFKGDFIISFLFIFLLAPLFIVKIWPLKPLKDPFLRKIILEFLFSQKIKFKEIYEIHEKEKKLYTAGIIGIFPPFRYLFFSKNLLEILTPEEILGVLAHEIGHLKRKHFFWLLLVILNFPFFLLLSLTLIFYPIFCLTKIFNFSFLEPLITFFFITLSFIYLRYIFAYFLRQFEREADLYSLYLLRDEKPLITALLKIGEVTKQLYKKSWHHYGILERIEFLKKAKKESLFLKNFTKKLKIFLIFWIFFNLFSVFLFQNWIFSFLINFFNALKLTIFS